VATGTDARGPQPLERLKRRYGPPAEAAYDGALAAASRLPRAIGYPAARVIGLARYWRHRRRLPIRPELAQRAHDDGELLRWKRRQSEQRAYAGLENRLLLRAGCRRAARAVTIDGLGYLDAALDDGRGAVLYSFHVGGILTALAGVIVLEYPLNLIRVIPPADLEPARLARRRRENMLLQRALPCRYLWMEPDNFGVAVKAVNALRRNEVVTALVDHAHAERALEVELLGGRSRLPAGCGRLAQAAKAPMLDLFCYRGKRPYPLVAEIGPPLRPASDVPSTVQQCADRLAAKVERHPETWFGSTDPAAAPGAA
jgi:lauroyl/myristoyl acyltransferase